jgi:hypothetical protein
MRGRLAEAVGEAAQAPSVGAFPFQLQPAGCHQSALGSRTALASAAHQELDPAQADEGAVGALVGEGGQQRTQELGVGRDERILQEAGGKAGVVVSFLARRLGRLRLCRKGFPGGLRSNFHSLHRKINLRSFAKVHFRYIGPWDSEGR